MRDLRELPAVVAGMGEATRRLPQQVILPLGRNVKAEVDRQGGRYHIKGRGGNPVRLGGRLQKAKIGRATSATGNVSVSGEPAGFWRIVEDGSSPHLIAARINGRQQGRGRGRAGLIRRFGEGDSIRGDKPVRTPGFVGGEYFDHVNHPGHGSIGQPWKTAMSNADNIVKHTLTEESARTLIRAWQSVA